MRDLKGEAPGAGTPEASGEKSCRCEKPTAHDSPRQPIFDNGAYLRRIESAARRWQQKRRGAK